MNIQKRVLGTKLHEFAIMAAAKRERRQSKREKSAILQARRALIEVSNFQEYFQHHESHVKSLKELPERQALLLKNERWERKSDASAHVRTV